MEEEKKQERSFELCSEKVRSIVGQIPSSLVRYGIAVIGMVLLSLFAVAYFLPYKQVYSGTAMICSIPTNSVSTDSISVRVQLKFEEKRLESNSSMKQRICLQSGDIAIIGSLKHLSSFRDSLGRQDAICTFAYPEAQKMVNQEVDFQILQSSGNLLRRMLGGL